VETVCRFEFDSIKEATLRSRPHPHSILRLVCLLSDPFKGTPTSVGRKDSADSVVPALRIMGTLEGTKTKPDLTFDGTAKNWPAFKQKLLKSADLQGFAYMLEAGQSSTLLRFLSFTLSLRYSSPFQL